MRLIGWNSWLAIAGAVTLAASAQAVADGPGLTLVKDGKSDYVIVLAVNAPPAAARGAAELRQHLRQMSGADLPIVDDRSPRPKYAIFVGPSVHSHASAASVPGEDGFVISTVGESIIVAGAAAHGRGTMYGCSELLEILGVRWFTPKVASIPHLSTVLFAESSISRVPAFEYREPYFTEALDKDWAARNKLIGNFQHLDASTGGGISYSIFVHSFDALIPPALHGTHPEYFPLINGKRAGGYVQRCLTNPQVLRLAIEGVRASFRDHPGARICSVSQNDCASWCACDECRRLTEKYGAHSGLYLWFVNQVAEAIEKDLPDKLIDTLAYQFTEAPPKGITPRANVRVRLCPISVCEAHPYESDDHPATKAFVANLAEWSRITDSLYIWHYNTNFAHYLMPFPDFDEFPASIRLYRRSGVKGVFLQGAYAPGGGGADAELRSFVMAKLLWNPSADADALVNEWMRGVYGEPAAKPMREWFDLIHRQVREPRRHLGIYDPPKPDLFPPAVLERGEVLFENALKLAGTPLQREYIEKARLGLRYVKLFQHPSSGKQLDEFLADVRRFGITQIREGGSVEQWEASIRAAAPKKE